MAIMKFIKYDDLSAKEKADLKKLLQTEQKALQQALAQLKKKAKKAKKTKKA
jgi:hypothetical protein